MRERYVRRQGLHWDEKRARILYVDRKARAHKKLPLRFSPIFAIITLICAIAGYQLWLRINDQPFPESGSVRISQNLDLTAPQGVLVVKGAFRDTIVELYTDNKQLPDISIYLQTGHVRNVPLPVGTYSLVTLTGQSWQGHRNKFGAGSLEILHRQKLRIENGKISLLDLAPQMRGA